MRTAATNITHELRVGFKSKETLFIRDLKPTLNDNASSEKLSLH